MFFFSPPLPGKTWVSDAKLVMVSHGVYPTAIVFSKICIPDPFPYQDEPRQPRCTAAEQFRHRLNHAIGRDSSGFANQKICGQLLLLGNLWPLGALKCTEYLFSASTKSAECWMMSLILWCSPVWDRLAIHSSDMGVLVLTHCAFLDDGACITGGCGWGDKRPMKKIFQGVSCLELNIGTGWWLTYPSEKYESQLGLWFPIYGKIKKCVKPPTRVKDFLGGLINDIILTHAQCLSNFRAASSSSHPGNSWAMVAVASLRSKLQLWSLMIIEDSLVWFYDRFTWIDPPILGGPCKFLRQKSVLTPVGWWWAGYTTWYIKDVHHPLHNLVYAGFLSHRATPKSSKSLDAFSIGWAMRWDGSPILRKPPWGRDDWIPF